MSLDAGRILVVDDEPAIRRLLRSTLGVHDYTVLEAASVAQALEVLGREKVDLVILDLGLPDRDGSALLRAMRARENHTPVLVLTARDEPGDKVRLLDLGADDYLVKPFDLAELQARIRAVARRAIARSGGDITVGSLRFDLAERRAYNGDNSIDLSPRELGVLEVLLLRKGRVVSKAQIQEHLCEWNEELTDGAIELYVHRLRKKLENTDVNLRTVRGFGYLLQPLTVEA